MKVGVLLALSSPSASLSKAQESEGWSSDIMTEVLGASSIVVTGSPSVSTGASPARVEFWVWWGGMTIQGVSSNILLSVEIKLKRGGHIKEGFDKLIPMDSFSVGQGVHQLQTRWSQSSGDDMDGQTWLQLMCFAP